MYFFSNSNQKLTASWDYNSNSYYGSKWNDGDCLEGNTDDWVRFILILINTILTVAYLHAIYSLSAELLNIGHQLTLSLTNLKKLGSTRSIKIFPFALNLVTKKQYKTVC